MSVYCAFCYPDWNNREMTTQEILANGEIEKAFVSGPNTAGRAKADELVQEYISYAVKCGNEQLSYRYGFFRVDLEDVRQERITITKEL